MLRYKICLLSHLVLVSLINSEYTLPLIVACTPSPCKKSQSLNMFVDIYVDKGVHLSPFTPSEMLLSMIKVDETKGKLRAFKTRKAKKGIRFK